MFRTHLLITTIGFLLAGCADDSTPPSAPEHQTRPVARVSGSAVERGRFQVRRLGADAFFATPDPSGCRETDVFVFAAQQAIKEDPGKPRTGPLAVVSVSEFNFCTQELLRDIFALSEDPVFQVDRTKLTEARLEATMTGTDNFTGATVPVQVDLAWTGTGELVSESSRFRSRTPGQLFSEWFKGTRRAATASGSVLVNGENLVTDTSIFADVFRARFGQFEIIRTTPQPPDTLP